MVRITVFDPSRRCVQEHPFSAWTLITVSRICGAMVIVWMIRLIWSTVSMHGAFAAIVGLSLCDALLALYPQWFTGRGAIWKRVLIGAVVGLVLGIVMQYVVRLIGM